MLHTPYRFLDDDDLSETQIYVTTQTYDRCAPEYAEKWERNPITIQEIKKYNIAPFQKLIKPKGTMLIVECQSGRDYQIFEKDRFTCIGTGTSFGLLSEALKRVPDGIFIRHSPRQLPFMPASFDSIYADALTSVPKRDIASVVTDFRTFLHPKGILYLSVKLGDKNVLELSDMGGLRYFTLYKKNEIASLLDKTGFEILWSEESPNTDRMLPHWFSVVARKKS